MSISEEERAELIQLEDTVAWLEDEIKVYKSANKDWVDMSIRLTRMQVELDEYVKRLTYLRSLI